MKRRKPHRSNVYYYIYTSLTLLFLLFIPRDTHAHGIKNPPEIKELSWMTGTWTGIRDGVEMEETWLAPMGGTMMGIHRDLYPSESLFFEYLRIEQKDRRLVYAASPMGKPEILFTLTFLEGTTVVFENPEHDFPKKITYSRSGDTLQARIEGTENGMPLSDSWTWSLVTSDRPYRSSPVLLDESMTEPELITSPGLPEDIKINCSAPRPWNVSLRYVVTDRGNVTDITLEKSSGCPDLDLMFILQSSANKYKPALRHGRPVSVWMSSTSRFRYD